LGSAAGTLVRSDMPHDHKLESARMFIPGWLRSALESTASQGSEFVTSRPDNGTLLPSLDGGELGLLSLLLGDLQSQMLRTAVNSPLTISLEVAQKHLSKFDIHSRERVGRAFQALAQLRLLVRTSDSAYSVLRLFDSEKWIIRQDGDHSPALQLGVSPHTFELLTGYVDSHLDLLRRIQGGPTLNEMNRAMSPLVVWTPVWLELALAEQLVYMRMESQMQTHGTWLRLDGLVGLKVEDLMRGIRTQKKSLNHQVDAAQSPFLDQLRLFGRLGRRLVAHGVIKKVPDSGFMALEGGFASEGPMLLWQASAERLRSRAEAQYLELLSSGFLAQLGRSRLEALLAIFAEISGKGDRALELLKSIWEAIKDRPGAACVTTPGSVVEAHLLFLEWLSRSCSETLVAMPLELSSVIPRSILGQFNAENIVQRFDSFCDVLGQIGLSGGKTGAFAAERPISIAIGKLSTDLLSRLSKIQLNTKNLDVNAHKLSGLTENKVAPKVSSGGAGAKLSLDSSRGDYVDSELPQGQKMHKLAHQELEKMMRQSPSAYGELKKKYISSLDSETRTLVLNVERRLDSRDFDRHLRSRLVRFMIDNPSSWTSVSTSLPI